ncbi:MAG: hypothetical protein HKN13_04535 [Rhodothermales bacterium]|nr:hypothetical protein [Rhodothermales bacterium]
MSDRTAADEFADQWIHVGWKNVRCFGLDIASGRSRDPVIFLSCGNGVLVSDDLSRWRVSTDWRVTEVLDIVCIGPKGVNGQPTVVAATAYGPFVSNDAGGSWLPAMDGLEGSGVNATFCTTICHARNSDMLVLGTEDGLFGLEWSDELQWAPFGPRGVAIRSICEDRTLGGKWFAASDGSGMLVSTADAQDWRTVLEGHVLYSVDCSSLEAGVVAAGGLDPRLWISRDHGETFDSIDAPLSSISIHALAFDMAEPDVVWVGSTENGVFRVDLTSGSWSFVGLRDASIRSLKFVQTGILAYRPDALNVRTGVNGQRNAE